MRVAFVAVVVAVVFAAVQAQDLCSATIYIVNDLDGALRLSTNTSTGCGDSAPNVVKGKNTTSFTQHLCNPDTQGRYNGQAGFFIGTGYDFFDITWDLEGCSTSAISPLGGVQTSSASTSVYYTVDASAHSATYYFHIEPLSGNNRKIRNNE